MPLLRIVKEYKNNSKLSGIVETDTLQIERDNVLEFVMGVNSNPKQVYKIIDYGWALVGGSNEIIVNPTNGYMGRMRNGKPDPS